MGPKKFWNRKFWTTKIFGQKKNWFQMNFGLKEILVTSKFGVKQNLGLRKLRSKNFGLKIFGQTKFGQKNLVQKDLRSSKKLGPKSLVKIRSIIAKIFLILINFVRPIVAFTNVTVTVNSC